jgi:myo-inositol-1(or 4)-monophosphatase
VITARFPDHAIFSEEGKHDKDLAAPVPTWIIDPLDGTSNYAHRFPYFAVSIGLAQHGELLAGVVYDPLQREMYVAEKGRGAFRQGDGEAAEPMRVSLEAELSQSLIGVGWPRDPARRETTMEAARRMGAACRTLRSLGTAALELVEVAAGGLDGYYHLSLQPWDVAAGALLIIEAGGRLSTPAGEPWQLSNPATLATNGRLHQPLLKTLAPAP